MDKDKKLLWIGTSVLTVLIIPLLIYFFFFKPWYSTEKNENIPADSPTLPVKVSETVPKPTQNMSANDSQDEESIKIPQDIHLNDSDEFVRQLLGDCTTHPEFLNWTKNKDLIRRGVAIIENISNGVSPATHLDFLLPIDTFGVIEKNGNLIIDPTSYIRYQTISMALVSIDSEKLVETYKKLQPLINQAYKELGYPEQNFLTTLENAIQNLLKTPDLEGDIYLNEKVTTYTFADTQLEALNDAQKHLLRMGPENVKKIKSKLEEILSFIKKISAD